MKISIVASMDENRGIGKENRIPWHVTEDLVRLKNLTIGHATILGRTSFESMLEYYEKSGRPTMMQRTHVVITRDPNYIVDKKYGLAAHSVEEAVELAKKNEAEEVFIIGGASIFKEAMRKNLIDRLYLTIIEGKHDVDTYFPGYSEFKKVISEEQHESGGQKFKFLTLEK